MDACSRRALGLLRSPCGEGLGVGVEVGGHISCNNNDPHPAFAALRRATLPIRGRVKTEFAARGDSTRANPYLLVGLHRMIRDLDFTAWPAVLVARLAAALVPRLPRGVA